MRFMYYWATGSISLAFGILIGALIPGEVTLEIDTIHTISKTDCITDIDSFVLKQKENRFKRDSLWDEWYKMEKIIKNK